MARQELFKNGLAPKARACFNGAVKTLPRKAHSNVSRRIARFGRYFSASCLTTIGLVSAASTAYALNHPPTISWLPDQRIVSGKFKKQYFRIWDNEQTLTAQSISVRSTNPSFTDPIDITWAVCGSNDRSQGCPSDGGYYIHFPNSPGNSADPSATLKVEVSDGTLSAATSFTLRKDSANNPPVIAGIPNETIQKVQGFGYGPVWFVVGDLDNSGNLDAVDALGNSEMRFEKSSDNPDLVPPLTGIDIQPIGGMEGRTFQVTVSPRFGAPPGRAVITITAIDPAPDNNKTSTSFVLDVIDQSNTPPKFMISGTGAGFTFLEQDVAMAPAYIDYTFKVTDAEINNKTNLLVTATSSNANLVPNDPINNLKVISIASDGSGTVRITPLPLPSPSPGVPQASTITLSVTDDAYTRRTQFLYIATNSNSPAIGFIRPAGVYNLDPKMPNDQRPNDEFLTGEMHRISWKDIDNGDPNPANWNWTELDDAVEMVENMRNGQDLSLNLTEEPCDIAQNAAVKTWCDRNPPRGQLECGTPLCSGGIRRAVPWDPKLRERRNNFLQQLAQHQLRNGHKVANESLISIINPTLPGGNTGIRELNGQPFSELTLPDYSRAALLGAVKDELLTVMRQFPGKRVQIGFFIVRDDQDAEFFDEPLWSWLYSRLRDQFNGNRQPRVHFFQEDLAAARASAAPDYVPYNAPPNNKTAYTFTPNSSQLPSFAYYSSGLTNKTYKNGITFQANTPWSGPFDDGAKVTKTLNGKPSDAMEAAFNAYLSQYLEVYRSDLDHAQAPSGPPASDAAKWRAGLQSWHDYTAYLRAFAPTESPPGLTVARISSTINEVSWYAVYGATYYILQRITLSAPGVWTDVIGCDPLSTACTDTASTGSQYAYRVRASNEAGTNLSPWTAVAVFLSEGSYDGYVSRIAGTYVPFPNVIQPGIQAGQGLGTDVLGFLSFDTTVLGSAVTILDAKLRLKQATNNAGFDSLGPCLVDIQKGVFNNNVTLEAADFTASATSVNVIGEDELAGVDSGNWVEAEFDPSHITDVNNTDRTQFRIYFNHVDGLVNTSVGWYSGESVGNEPQLIVQYTETEP